MIERERQKRPRSTHVLLVLFDCVLQFRVLQLRFFGDGFCFLRTYKSFDIIYLKGGCQDGGSRKGKN